MTDDTVDALAAQCPSDVPHLVAFYSRYFKEQGRFPVLEKPLLWSGSVTPAGLHNSTGR